MAVDQSENTALYIIMGVYAILLLSVGVFAFRLKKREMSNVSASSAHFGGSFNPVFLTLTLIASIFSGYTVTGIPAEAYRAGFGSLRWLPGAFVIALAYLLFAPRLRRLAVERSYSSPNDFIKDRFRSPLLTLMCTVFMCVPQVLYCTVQFSSFAYNLAGLTLGAVDLGTGRLIMGLIIFVLELAGGMKSVVLSDAIQGTLMLFGFVLLPAFALGYYGTFGNLSEEYCSNCFFISSNSSLGACPESCEAEAPSHCTMSGCMPQVAKLYSYPTWTARFGMLWFIVTLIFFPLNPHMVQRMYIARDDMALKVSSMILFLMPFLAAMPGIITGIVKKVVEQDWPVSSQKASAFSGMCIEIMGKGTFEYFIVSVLNCAALAAIMSTADSVILGVSSTITFDVFKDILRPKATDREMVYMGYTMSAIMVILSIVLAYYILPPDFGTVLTIQNGLLGQAAPAYLAGLWLNVSTKAVTAGCIGGLLVFLIMFIYTQSADVPPDITLYVPDIIWGLGANVIIVFLGYFLFPENTYEENNERWGPRLSSTQIASIMGDIKEPSYWVIPVSLVGVVLCLPWWGAEGADMSELTINGFPEWGVYMMVVTGVLCALGFYGASVWDPKPSALKATAAADAAAASDI